MAKKSKAKVSSKESCCAVGSCDYSPTLYIDFDDMKEVKGVCVGDEIRLVVKGTVRSVEQREGYDDKEKARASVSLKDFEAEILDASTQFDSLLDDDDE